MPEPERPPPSPDEPPGFGGAFGRWLVHVALGMAAIVVGYLLAGDGDAASGGMVLLVVGLAVVLALFGAWKRPRGPWPWP